MMILQKIGLPNFILLYYPNRIFCIYKPFFDVFDEIETNNGNKMRVDRKIAQNK